MESLWGGGESRFVDMRVVSATGGKVDRRRPIFHHGAAEAEVIIDPAIIGLDEFGRVAELAGRMIGIGDDRQRYGRFGAAIEEI